MIEHQLLLASSRLDATADLPDREWLVGVLGDGFGGAEVSSDVMRKMAILVQWLIFLDEDKLTNRLIERRVHECW
jgi:hypothetical protein